MIPRAAIPYLWMTVVFLLSSVPAGALPASPIRGADKVIHFLLYGVLVLAFRPAAASRRLPGEWLPGAVAAALVFAMFDEVHQSWVPGRSPDPGDLLADAAGVAVAGVLAAGRWSPYGACRILFRERPTRSGPRSA